MPQVAPSQVTTFKFQTPLRAKVLNTLISDIATEGLLTRPSLRVDGANQGQIYIGKFGAIVRPVSKVNGVIMDQSAVKVTTTEETILSWVVPSATDYTYYRDSPCAVGLMYEFEEANATGVPMLTLLYPNEVYDDGDDKMKIGDFKGVIVCTIQHKRNNDTFLTCLSTYGADISSSLMAQDGWNPNWFLSPVSPREYDFTIAEEPSLYRKWVLHTQAVYPRSAVSLPGIKSNPSGYTSFYGGYSSSYRELVFADFTIDNAVTLEIQSEGSWGAYRLPSHKVVGTITLLSSGDQSPFWTNIIDKVLRIDDIVPVAFFNGVLDIG